MSRTKKIKELMDELEEKEAEIRGLNEIASINERKNDKNLKEAKGKLINTCIGFIFICVLLFGVSFRMGYDRGVDRQLRSQALEDLYCFILEGDERRDCWIKRMGMDLTDLKVRLIILEENLGISNATK